MRRRRHRGRDRAAAHHRHTTRLGTIASVATLLVAGVVHVPAAPATASDSVAELVARYTPPDGVLDPVLSALANGTIGLGAEPPVPGTSVLPPVKQGYAIPGSELGRFDITDTDEAQAEIAAFVRRLQERGIDVDASLYRVFVLPTVVNIDGSEILADPLHALPIGTDPATDVLVENEGPLSSVLVVPADTGIELVGAVYHEGFMQVKTLLSASPLAGLEEPAEDFDPSQSAVWDPAGGLRCLERKQNSTAWYDPCQWWYSLRNDGDGNRNTYGYRMYGTGKSRGQWTLAELEVQSWRKSHTSDQDWVDWDPGADSTMNCTPVTVGINVRAAYLEVTKQHCEQWDIHKGAEPADFANRWQGSRWRKERESASVVATSVPNGQVPTDYFDFDYYAY